MIALALAALITAQAAVVDRVAAVVNNDVIALSEIYDLGAPYIGQRCGALPTELCRREAELEVLESLIQRALMRAELEKQGMGVTAEDRDRAVSSILKDNSYASEAELRAAIEEGGLAWETYLEQISEQLMAMKFEQLISARVVLSDSEVQDLYQRSARAYSGPPLMEIQATLWPASTDQEALADQAGQMRAQAEALRAGTLTWEAFAAALPGAMQQSMGTVRASDLSPVLSGALEPLAPGEVTEVLGLNGMLVVLRLDARKASDVLPFAEVESQLREKVREDRVQEEVGAWYTRARKQAAIQIKLEDPSSSPPATPEG